MWEWTYDSYGNQTQAKDPLLNTSTTTYSTLGWPLVTTDPTGVQESATYDNLGRKTKVTHVADNSYVETTFNAEDLATSVRDENAKVTSISYTVMNWVSSTTDPKNQTTSFGYNPRGVRTSLTNARSKTTTFEVDAAGRVRKTTYPDLTTEETTFDADGNVSSRKDGRAYTVSNSWDTV